MLPAAAADAGRAPTGHAPVLVHERAVVVLPPRRGAIRIDGRLDDAGWRRAARIDDFVEIDPGDNVPPAARTEAWFTWDSDAFYVALRCHDPDPASIRASITDRDEIFADDWAGVIIDTFDDEQNAYEFLVNPCGVQGDLHRTRNREDVSFDAVWSSAARRTDTGWEAELAIPFRSIRFPDVPRQRWGVHVFRVRPRASRETISWRPVSRDDPCLLCQAGHVEGMAHIRRGHGIELLPYALGSQRAGLEPGALRWRRDPVLGDAGLGVKYGITPNVTLDATFNPDFSQIESDASQIDANTTFALFFPERRPFFLEGADIFETRIAAVYTRSINDPLVAAKVTGKSGRTAFGALVAVDEHTPWVLPFEERSEITTGGRSVSTIVRVRRDVLSESHVGLLVTDRRLTSGRGRGTVAGLDARIRLGEAWAADAEVLVSVTREPDDAALSAAFDTTRFGNRGEHTPAFDGERFTGTAMRASVERNGRHLTTSAWYEDFAPTFRADNGFVTSNDFRMGGLWAGWMFYGHDGAWLERVRPQVMAGRKFNHRGVFKDEWLAPGFWVRLRGQTNVNGSFLVSSERFSGVRVRGIRRWEFQASTQFSHALSGGLSARLGRSLVRDRSAPRLGRERNVSVWAQTRPSTRLRIEASVTAFRLDEIDGSRIADQKVWRLRGTWQFTRRLFLRTIVDYADASRTWRIDPLLSYKLNPFTVFFLGSSHTLARVPDASGSDALRQSDRVFFVKFQYLLRM